MDTVRTGHPDPDSFIGSPQLISGRPPNGTEYLTRKRQRIGNRSRLHKLSRKLPDFSSEAEAGKYKNPEK
jgi:hypothetical protein